jgi:hypothetical protein
LATFGPPTRQAAPSRPCPTIVGSCRRARDAPATGLGVARVKKSGNDPRRHHHERTETKTTTTLDRPALHIPDCRDIDEAIEHGMRIILVGASLSAIGGILRRGGHRKPA